MEREKSSLDGAIDECSVARTRLKNPEENMSQLPTKIRSTIGDRYDEVSKNSPEIGGWL